MSDTTAQKLDLTAISERYFAAWAARDPDAIVALHTDDTRFWTHLGTGPVRGRDAVRGDVRRDLRDSSRISRTRPTACSTARTIGCSTGR